MAAQHQHYVPRLLLRGFLSRDEARAKKEQVHVLDLAENRVFTPNIDAVMGERRFNDFWIDDDTLATIEPGAGRIETYVTDLVHRIRADKRLRRSPEEQGDLALLMAFQFVRTKKMRLLPERLALMLKSRITKMGFDPAKVEGLEIPDENELKRHHVRQQVKSLATFVDIIAEKEFFLMCAPAGRSFYLGDHPVVMHNDEQPPGLMAKLGLAVPYIQLYLPLAADVLLCAYDKAVLGQWMRNHEERMLPYRKEALGQLMRGAITPDRMRDLLEQMENVALVKPMIESIRAGLPIPIGIEQVQFYNSLQAFHAHRFVVDPEGEFVVARDMISVRAEADERGAG
jgi:hypothetical protein